MLTRLLIVAGVALALAAVCAAIYLAQKRRAAAQAASLPALDRPTVLYFWSEMCAPCKLVQAPAVERLEAELGSDRVRVIRINADAEPQAAQQWGVYSVPTTIVLDAARQPRHINNNVAPFERLRQQVESV